MKNQFPQKPVLDAVAAAIKSAVSSLDSRMDEIACMGEDRSESEQQRIESLRADLVALESAVGYSTDAIGKRIDEVDKGAVERMRALSGELADLYLTVNGAEDEREERSKVIDSALVAIRAEIKAVESEIPDIDGLRDDLTTTLDLIVKLEDQLEPIVGIGDAQVELSASLAALRQTVGEHMQGTVEAGIALSELALELTSIDAKHSLGVDRLGEEIESAREIVSAEISTLGLRIEEMPEVVEGNLIEVREKIDAHGGELERHVSGTGEKFSSVDMELLSLQEELAGVDSRFANWNTAYRDAEQWGRGGSAYKEGAIVRHRGGVWQAGETTDDEPRSYGHWRLLAEGLCDIRLIRPDPSNVVFRAELASGTVIESDTIILPRDNPTGRHDPDRSYERDDTFVHHRNRYKVVRSGKIQDPATSDLCALDVQGGQRGARGPQGDPGRPPEMAEILQQFQDYIDQGDGAPIRTFRGRWTYGDSYVLGDVVVFGDSLRICLEANNGTVPPGGAPGQTGSDEWAVLFSAPSGGGGGGGGASDAMVWHYPYSPTETYKKNSVVNDTGWLMIANKETSDSAAPVATGPASYIILDDPPAWDTASDNAVIHSGMVVEFTESGWWEHVRVAVPSVVTNVFTRVGLYNITDPDNIHFYYVNDPQLIAGQWSEVVSVAVFVRPGTKYFLFQEVYDDSNETTFNGEWLYEGTGGPDPAIGSWSRTAHNVIYVSKIDSNGGNRSAELLSILPSSEIVTQEIADPSLFSTYLVNGLITDDGTYVTIPVDRQGNAGAPGTGEPSTLYFRVPITAHTDYYRIENYWQTNQPSWAVVSGRLLLNGVEQPGEEDTAFGVDIDFTPAYVSPDWDVMAVTGDIGPESGNPSGGTLVDYGEQPQDLGSIATTLTIDISLGQTVLAALTGDVSAVAFTNPSAHAATSFALLLDTGGFDVLDWSGAVSNWFGAAPDLSSGGTHGFGFELMGGSWYGTHKGQVN